MKYLVPILIAIIIILVGALSFSVGKSGLPFGKSVPSQENATSPTTTPAAEAPEMATQKVTGGGILSFPEYELTVPSDWEVKRESEGQDNQKVILTKGSYQFSILQGGFGGAACLYEGDADIEGPSARYDDYKEITSQDGDSFRRSWTGTELAASGYGICQKTQYGWGAPSLYGSISFVTPAVKSSQMLNEMDEILASIRKI
jgi:hypothetical protein